MEKQVLKTDDCKIVMRKNKNGEIIVEIIGNDVKVNLNKEEVLNTYETFDVNDFNKFIKEHELHMT